MSWESEPLYYVVKSTHAHYWFSVEREGNRLRKVLAPIAASLAETVVGRTQDVEVVAVQYRLRDVHYLGISKIKVAGQAGTAGPKHLRSLS